jgi:hypothetical protein
MNCGVCSRAFRAEARCAGCRGDGAKPSYCDSCRIRNCEQGAAAGLRFCFECASYPCARLRRLDLRYRRRYETSLIENLEGIRRLGVDAYLESERQRWTCAGCGALTCVHKDRCLSCGERWGRGEAAPSAAT